MPTLGYAIPTTDDEWAKLAQSVLDRKPKNPSDFVEAAVVLAHFVVNAKTSQRDYMQMVEQLGVVQARCTELLEERRTLARVIEKIAAAGPEDRDEMIAEAIIAARGSQ
jgi:hypothetical protein